MGPLTKNILKFCSLLLGIESLQPSSIVSNFGNFQRFLSTSFSSFFTKFLLKFSDWKVMYENSPREMVKLFGLDWSIYGDLILGGEAAMWSEQVKRRF